ncbi:MAG: alpha/beta hydrolase [Enterococcus sp.]
MQQVKQFEDKNLVISIPKETTANEKLPVLYVLDGNAFGPLVERAILLQGRNPRKTGVDNAIVVAIGYDTEEAFQREARFVDYTPRRENGPEESAKRRNMPEGGGIEAFQEQINRIHVWLCKHYPVNTEKIGLLGHSLGGLCVLESYLVAEKLPFITDFLAISPSLWWDHHEFFAKLDAMEQFADRRIFVAVENDEGEMEEAAALCVQHLATHLSSEQVGFYVGPDENHMSIVFTSLSRILRWFFEGRS